MPHKAPRRTKLIEARLAKGLLQKDIAKALGVSTSFYGMIEQGARTPRLREALVIQEIVGRPLEELFPDLEPNETLGKNKSLEPTGTEEGR